eukprot:gb/GECG01001317.1/.p1 GENE.gb/GECG01001317.1/~~gb/GECG01001317.1/.p1  ORF type:complete len:279 (+),score=9.31 gb/GECG01001317.1/:1-837(+)
MKYCVAKLIQFIIVFIGRWRICASLNPPIQVEFRYIKWTVTEIRNENDHGSRCGSCRLCPQAAEFELRDGNTPLSMGNFENPGGDQLPREDPSHLGGPGKWLDHKYATNGMTSIIISDAGSGSSYTFNRYTWKTGDDCSQRDPISWTLHGSNDKDNWIFLDMRNNEDITTDRSTYAGIYNVRKPSPTPSPTRTPTATITPTPSRTVTPTRTPSSSRTRTPTNTATPTPSVTSTRTPSITRTSTMSPSSSESLTPTPSTSAIPNRLVDNVPVQRPQRYF